MHPFILTVMREIMPLHGASAASAKHSSLNIHI